MLLNIVLVVLLILVIIHTLTYARWLYGQEKNKVGALVVGVLIVYTIIATIIEIRIE